MDCQIGTTITAGTAEPPHAADSPDRGGFSARPYLHLNTLVVCICPSLFFSTDTKGVKVVGLSLYLFDTKGPGPV